MRSLVFLLLFGFSIGSIRADGLSAHTVTQSARGPWGEMVYFPIFLESPSLYLDGGDSGPSILPKETVWKFQVENAEELSLLMGEAGLPKELVENLLSEEFLRFNEETGFHEVRPPDSVVLELTPEQRIGLYQKTVPQKGSNIYYAPYPLSPGGFREVTSAPSGLSDETIDLVDRLSYRDGFLRRFSDLPFVLKKTTDPEEQNRVIKVLSRERSLSVRLLLSQDSNLEEIADYWSGSGRNREIMPILESVLRTDGVHRIDLVHLLPPVPRKLLNTYPSPIGEGFADRKPDCFWTSLNFFADEPSDRYLEEVGQALDERYEIVRPPFQFGDLILIQEDLTGEWLHAFNYLADRLVYTKNGNSMARPWVISELDRVIKTYRSAKGIQVIFFRLRPEFRK